MTAKQKILQTPAWYLREEIEKAEIRYSRANTNKVKDYLMGVIHGLQKALEIIEKEEGGDEK